jgi:PAS domain S-box-containing protein
MNDQDKSREQLLEELHALRDRLARLEAAAGGPLPPEDPLRQFPAWVSQTLDTIDDTFIVLDRDWRFRYANRAALAPTREPLAGLLGRPLWEKYPELLGTPTEAHYRRAMAEQVPAHFETPGLLTGRWLEVHAYPSPDALVVYARDASQRRRAEEALRESEARFRQMAETIDEVVWMRDAERGQLLYVSPAYETIWGRSCRSLYERPPSWLEAVHPEDRDRVAASFVPLADHGGAEVEYRVVRPDGSVRWVLDRSFAVRDECGRVYRHVGLAKDVTERQQAEESLRRSEGRLRRFFEAAFEGLVIHAGGVILDANQAAADLFGCPIAALVGRPVLDFAAPEWHDEIRRRIRSGHEAAYEAVAVRTDGSSFPIELRGKGTEYQGRPARVTAVRDVTERKRAEAALRESAQRLQLLSRRLLEVQEEERRRLARELHDEVAQVLIGLNYTLELSRRSGGSERDATLAQAQVLVQELAREVRDTSLLLRPSMLDDLGLEPALLWHCRRYGEQAGLRVELEQAGLGRRLPAEVETAAYRVVQEALSNVARHAGVDRATVRVRAEGGRLHIAVEDRGAGFDPAAVHAAANGSGLSGMEERVALLGGRLVVESAPGSGTRLTVELPLGASGESQSHGDPPAGR